VRSSTSKSQQLRRSPVVLPIPGTPSIAHLEENIAGAAIALTDAEFEALSDAAK
jgi:pyridoxine 4-dehydrogenase